MSSALCAAWSLQVEENHCFPSQHVLCDITRFCNISQLDRKEDIFFVFSIDEEITCVMNINKIKTPYKLINVM